MPVSPFSATSSLWFMSRDIEGWPLAIGVVNASTANLLEDTFSLCGTGMLDRGERRRIIYWYRIATHLTNVLRLQNARLYDGGEYSRSVAQKEFHNIRGAG